MRVLVLASEWFPDRAGGNARVTTEVARGLAARGHEVVVVAPAHPELPRTEAAGTLAVRRVLPRGPWPATFADTAFGWRWARREASRFDAVLSHTSTTLLGALAGGLRAPVAVVFHAPGADELRLHRDRRPGLDRKRLGAAVMIPTLAAFERHALRRARRVLTLSRYTRSLVEERYPGLAERVRPVSGGVDTTRFSPGDGTDVRRKLGLRPDQRLLVTVRRLEARMGLEHLLRAATGLPEETVVAVVGTGPLERRLRQQAREAGLDDRFRLVGGVPDHELATWYRAADLFVLPTLAYEGFGMATLEALASGTPVVGTDAGATPELLAPIDPSLVVPAGDADALAAAIRRTLARGDLDELGLRCLRRARERYDWGAVVPRWEAVLSEL